MATLGRSPRLGDNASLTVCAKLNVLYPHGVGEQGARDKTSSGQPVTNFRVHATVYKLNTSRDRDNDGIACEKM